MKAIATAFICIIVCIKSMAQSPDYSTAHQLANRLSALSETGEPTKKADKITIVHKKYQEDTQTVTQNKDGKYVVHIDTVIGEQNDNEKPTITKYQDEFIVPSDEDELQKMWEQIWNKNGATKQVLTADSAPPAFPPLPPTNEQVPGMDEWVLADDIAKLLEDDFVIPDELNDFDYSQFAGKYMNFMDYDDVWKFDEAAGEWVLDAAKYEEKYGITPYAEDNYNWDGQIESLQQDISEEEEAMELEQEVIAEEEKEATIEDIVSVDPITGKIQINEEAYYKTFGAYPSFEDGAIDAVQDWNSQSIATKPDPATDGVQQDKWWSAYDELKPSPKGLSKDIMERMDKYDGLFGDAPDSKPAPAAAA